VTNRLSYGIGKQNRLPWVDWYRLAPVGEARLIWALFKLALRETEYEDVKMILRVQYKV
jgi:hypothetical protein